MKIETVAASLFGAVDTLSAGYYTAMDVDTWCLTYVSTYLAPVSVPSGSPPSTTRDSDTATKGKSLEPTFGSDTSTQTTTDTDTQDASTSVASLIFPESLQTSLLSSTGLGPSTLDIDPQSISSAVITTILTLTDEPTTSLGPTASTDLTSTSSGFGIIEPAGRAVILQIVVPDNEKRDLNRRATNGFVGNENPDVCTFATTFNLAGDQLFDGGVPIFYSGEDFKELSGQGSPSSDAITTSFEEPGQQLVFRNPDLPNGEGSFCQNSNGLIYIVFTTGPSSCVPVSLAVYDVEQCQNGRLVGVDELTSTTGITSSEITSPETISSGTAIITSTEGVVNYSVIESTGATEVTTSTESSSGSLDKSTSVSQAELVESQSGTASHSTPTTVSTRAIDSSTSLSSIVTTQAVQETSVTELPALPTSTEGGSRISVTTAGPVAETSATGVSTSSDTVDGTTTEGGGSVSSSIATEPVSKSSTAEVGTSSQESSSIGSTESASITNTSIESQDSTAESSSPPASDTTSEALADTTSSATTETTEAGTTVTLPALDQTSSTEIAGIEDSTTANANIPTTTEGDAVRDTTTTALEATTTAIATPCTVVENPYDAAGGGQFFIYCDSDVDTSTTLESVSDISLQACIDNCSLNSDCKGVRHVKSTNLCLLLSFGGALIPNDETDIAFLDQGE